MLMQASRATAVTPPTPQEVLATSCVIYAENWQGLRYHYPDGKEAFLQKCLAAIAGKPLVEGLWALRALMPDGHADFQIYSSDAPSKTYPLMLTYDVTTQEVRVAAAFAVSLLPYVGKKVVAMHGRPILELLADRAALEPQSSTTSALEIAARTLTATFRKKPYPGFTDTIKIAFEGQETLETTAVEWETVLEEQPFALSRNGYPSFWGDVEISEENGYCLGEMEVATSVALGGKTWFWWHPRGLRFDLDAIEQAFACWEAGIQKADGVVLDLRDSSGGGLNALYTVGYQFHVQLPDRIESLVSDGDIAVAIMIAEGETLGPKTAAGYVRDVERTTPEAAHKLTRWEGPLVVITNGLCGSLCDVLAYHLQSRIATCTYGTPTAGRLIGYDDVHPVAPESGIHVDLSLPFDEYLKPDGSRWEGDPVVPKHLGNGSIMEALQACGYR